MKTYENNLLGPLTKTEKVEAINHFLEKKIKAMHGWLEANRGSELYLDYAADEFKKQFPEVL
jgi:hypothetical protein